MKHRPSVSPSGIRSEAAVLCALLVLLLSAATGCGPDDSENVIVVELEPWGLDFYVEMDQQSPPQPHDFLVLVERVFYLSVLRFEKVKGIYNLFATIGPPATGGFSPLTVDVATGAASAVMFVTDITEGNQRLLAVRPGYSGETGLETLLLAETGGSPTEDFIDLNGVASLYLGGDAYRVFLSDDNKIWIIDYNVTSQTFSYGTPAYPKITGGCLDSFRTPVGVAVDDWNDPVTNRPALYVVDQGQEALFRFSGIGGGVPSPVCNGVLKEWEAGGNWFEDPRGVGVLSGEDVAGDTLIVVADNRKTPDGNDRITAFSWNALTSAFEPEALPANFTFFPNARPFDMAFEGNGNLWATYPEASAVAGPTQ